MFTPTYYQYSILLIPGINLLFPFLPYMIHDFFPELDRTQIGELKHSPGVQLLEVFGAHSVV